MGDVEEVRDPAHQVFLVLVEVAVRVRHPPQQLHDVRLLVGVELPVDDARELVQGSHTLGPFLGPRQQLPRLVRREVAERRGQRPEDRFPLIGPGRVVGAHDLDQQRRRRQMIAVLAFRILLGAGHGDEGGFEESPERPDHDDLR